MNKFIEALEKMCHGLFTRHEYELLKEFIELNTPTKPQYVFSDEPVCPSCHTPLDGTEAHCDICDQRIDWSEE